MTMVTAMLAVKPVVMVCGTKRMSVPRRMTPITISSTPAMMVAATSPLMPSVATIPATMVANAAVGPEIYMLASGDKSVSAAACLHHGQPQLASAVCRVHIPGKIALHIRTALP